MAWILLVTLPTGLLLVFLQHPNPTNFPLRRLHARASRWRPSIRSSDGTGEKRDPPIAPSRCHRRERLVPFAQAEEEIAPQHRSVVTVFE